MLSVGWILFHRFAHSFLFETFADNVKNWYYKVRQLFQNETENSHKKLLQSPTEIYYKVRQVLQTWCDRSLL